MNSRITSKGNTLRLFVILVLLFFILVILFFRPIVRGDGLGYYVYLPSIILDHDLDFRNNFMVVNRWHPGARLDVRVKTRTGLMPNPWSVGPAILWSPAYLSGFVINNLIGRPADGYDFTFRFVISLMSVLYTFLGVILMFKLVSRFFSEKIAFLSSSLILIATPLLYYGVAEPILSHGPSFFAVSWFLYEVSKTKGMLNTRNSVKLGLLGGFMSLMRWQNMLYLSIPLLYSFTKGKLFVLHKNEVKFNFSKDILKGTLIFLFFVFVALLPQMMVWKMIYGSFITIPHLTESAIYEEKFYFYPKYFFHVLLSTKHGLIPGAPIIFFSLVGLLSSRNKDKHFFNSIILALALQIAFIGSYDSWFGSWSVGMRFLVGISPVFALGLAGFIERMAVVLRITFTLLFTIFVLWNLLLTTQAILYPQMTSPDTNFRTLLYNQVKVMPNLFSRYSLYRFGLIEKQKLSDPRYNYFYPNVELPSRNYTKYERIRFYDFFYGAREGTGESTPKVSELQWHSFEMPLNLTTEEGETFFNGYIYLIEPEVVIKANDCLKEMYVNEMLVFREENCTLCKHCSGFSLNLKNSTVKGWNLFAGKIKNFDGDVRLDITQGS